MSLYAKEFTLKQYRISSENMWYEIHNDFGCTGGTYILKCLQANNSPPIPVNRLLASDEEGILYIGKANSFIDRVAELKKSISPEYLSSSHECGSRYKINNAIQEKYPYENLIVELQGSNNPREKEAVLLKEYEYKFGELPPLNRSS